MEPRTGATQSSGGLWALAILIEEGHAHRFKSVDTRKQNRSRTALAR